MPEQRTPEHLAFEIGKRKLAIGQQYKTINEMVQQLREMVGVGQPIEIPQLGKALAIVDNFEASDIHWKKVCCERFEVVMSDL